MSELKRITLRLDKNSLKKLDAIAAKRGMNRNALLNYIIETYVIDDNSISILEARIESIIEEKLYSIESNTREIKDWIVGVEDE